MEAVPSGTMVMGHELCDGLGIEVGDSVTVLGHRFKVDKCHEPRGNRDDITVWVNLAEAQELLDKKGLINAILALECRCVADGTLPNIGKIRSDLEHILPETQVIEFMSRALTRAEARYKASLAAKKALEQEESHREAVRIQRENAAATAIPIAVAACLVLAGLLAYDNARKRRTELGVLRALGIASRRILWLFLAKAVVVGLLGAVLGLALGFGAVTVWVGSSIGAGALLYPVLFVGVLVGAPVLSVLASWVPALVATQQDPAVILREE
jgi:ABC-type lipoprotein release transport system permease subunit